MPLILFVEFRWLVEERGIIGLGIDTPSTDFGQSRWFAVYLLLCMPNSSPCDNLLYDNLLFPGNFSLTECWVPPMCGELKTWPGFYKHDNLTCLSFPFLKSKTDELSHLANQDRSAASHWF